MTREDVAHSAVLALACLITYEAVVRVLASIHSLSRSDDLLGGMWGVVATVFVCRDVYAQDVAAARSRLAATSLSFVLCFAYLLVLPSNAAGMAALIGLGALILTGVGRPGDAVTASITTAVVMVVGELSPRAAWEQPILRLADTIVGIAVGMAAGLIALRVRPAVTMGATPDRR